MKSFALVLILAALATGSAFANPSLKGDITVNADIVTVGDMFDNPGQLSEMAIFRAPAPGTTGVVPIGDVEHAAQLIGLTDFDNVGYSRIRVVRVATIVDATTLGALISTELGHRGILTGAITADTRFNTTDVSFNASQVDAPASLADLRYSQQTGAFTARFMIAGIDRPIDLSGTIQLMTRAPQLVATRGPGSILAASDFTLTPVPVVTANAGGYADLDQLVGKQLIRQSREGMMLKPSDVADPTVVTRNAVVTVLLKTGPMTLTVRGQALGAASAGQPVDVLNTLTKKVLHGVARADGAVEILTATAVASL